MTVLNKKRDAIPRGSVFIGRPSKWGNPFAIGKDGTRDDVITKYAVWLANNPQLMAEARAELRGKNLVCFCAPAPCHGHVLYGVANG